MVDLFAGTGGASAAFIDAGWRVLRVDLEPARIPGAVAADVRALPFGRELGAVELLWASPPCTEFSDADPRVDHARKRPSLELVSATLSAVAELRPRWWILENVRGAIPFLGIPAQKVGPWCLWGYFPPIAPSFDAQTHRKWQHHTAASRAAVPRELSEAVLRSVGRHRDVKSLLDLRPFRRHRHAAAKGRPAIADLFGSRP